MQTHTLFMSMIFFSMWDFKSEPRVNKTQCLFFFLRSSQAKERSNTKIKSIYRIVECKPNRKFINVLNSHNRKKNDWYKTKKSRRKSIITERHLYYYVLYPMAATTTTKKRTRLFAFNWSSMQKFCLLHRLSSQFQQAILAFTAASVSKLLLVSKQNHYMPARNCDKRDNLKEKTIMIFFCFEEKEKQNIKLQTQICMDSFLKSNETTIS